MSLLRGSANCVWCTKNVLGEGATGAVFQGVNKSNGDPFAVKTFNQLKPDDVQLCKFEILKRVKHENIVKLLKLFPFFACLSTSFSSSIVIMSSLSSVPSLLLSSSDSSSPLLPCSFQSFS